MNKKSVTLSVLVVIVLSATAGITVLPATATTPTQDDTVRTATPSVSSQSPSLYRQTFSIKSDPDQIAVITPGSDQSFVAGGIYTALVTVNASEVGLIDGITTSNNVSDPKLALSLSTPNSTQGAQIVGISTEGEYETPNSVLSRCQLGCELSSNTPFAAGTERTVLVRFYINRTNAPNKITLSADPTPNATSNGDSAAVSYDVEKSVNQSRAMARTAEARAELAAGYLESYNALLYQESWDNRFKSSMSNAFTVVANDAARSLVTGYADNVLTRATQLGDAGDLASLQDAQTAYGMSQSKYGSGTIGKIARINENLYNNLRNRMDIDEIQRQGNSSYALRRLQSLSQSEATAWRENNKTKIKEILQKKRLVLSGYSNQVDDGYKFRFNREFDRTIGGPANPGLKRQAAAQKVAAAGKNSDLYNYFDALEKYSESQLAYIENTALPLARDPAPQVSTRSSRTTLRTRLSELGPNETMTLTFEVSNGNKAGVTSQQGYLSISTADGLNVTGVRQIDGDDELSVTNYSIGDEIYYKDSDNRKPAVHPLIDIREQYDLGETNTYEVTITNESASSAWLTYRTAFEPLIHEDSPDAEATFARYPNAAQSVSTDQQNFPAINISAESDPTNQPPIAQITTSETTVVEGTTVSFDGINSIDDAGITSYKWNVYNTSNGNRVYKPKSGQQTTFTFNSQGVVNITLTVTDSSEETATTSQTLTVTYASDLSPSFQANRTVIEPGRVTKLRATTAASTYNWDLDGDKTYDDRSGKTTIWRPTSAGDAEVGLQVTTENGVQATTRLSYTVESADKQLTEPTPVVDAPATVSVGEPATFDASESTDQTVSGNQLVSGPIMGYSWDFDADGNTDATGVSTSTSFDTPGSYAVNVTVTDGDGNTASSIVPITVISGDSGGDDGGFVEINTSDLSGAGTTSNPYLITNASELQAIEDDLDANYSIVSDIDATDTAEWNGGKGFTPIGENPFTGDPFRGTIYGAGHNVIGLTITRLNEKRVGLFAGIGGSGTVNGVSLVDANVTGESRVGGLIGENAGGKITDSSVSGQITGTDVIGGLMGEHEAGTVSGSYSTATVSGNTRTGGLIGRVLGSVSKSYATGNVSGNKMIGGIIGENENFNTIRELYATGDVTGSSEVGGLVGRNWGTISKSIAFGTVTGDNRVGGLVGRNGHSGYVPDQPGSIKRSYARGNVTATTERGGGLVGHNDAGDITKAYAIGHVSGAGTLGGLIGDNGGTVVDSYFNTETTGQDTSGVGTGLKTTEMIRSSARDTMDGFNFSETWQTRSGGYPTLGWYLNTPPRADAGPNRSVTPGETVTINGTRSTDDGEIAQYRWDIDNDGVFERSAPAQTLSMSSPGDRRITLKVIDNYGEESTDTVKITIVDDIPPIANATATSTGYRRIRLSGEQSTDNGVIASYEWDTDSDGNYETTGKIATVTYQRPGTDPVTIRVTDTSGNSDTAMTNITVANSAPTAEFAPENTVFGGQSIRLNGSATDPDGDPLTYSWAVINGSGMVSGTGDSGTYTAPSGLSQNRSAVVRLTVSDGPASDSATVPLTLIRDRPSTVVTRSSWRVLTNTSVRFDARRSRDLDGTIKNYTWDVDGDGVTDATGPQTIYAFDTSGYHTVSLTVTDNDNKSTTAIKPVHVSRPEAWHSWGDDPANTGTNPSSGVTQPIIRQWTTAAVRGVSSPAIVNGSVYITDDNGSVYALDAATGAIRWTYSTGNESLSSPVVANGTVYVGSERDTVYALDAGTGVVRWTAAGSGATFASDRDRFTRPVVTDDTVIVASHTIEEGSSYTNENGRVYAFDAKTGAERWNEPLEVSGTLRSGDVSSVAVYNETVYVSQLIWMHAFDVDSGAKEWTTSTGDRSSLLTPVASNGTVYAGSSKGIGYAFDGVTGSIRWQTDDGVGDSSPVVADQSVIFGSTAGLITALYTANGSVHWQSSVGSGITSSPTVVGDTLYSIGFDGTLYTLETVTGDIKWRQATAVWEGTTPAVLNERLYVGGTNGTLLAIGAPDQSARVGERISFDGADVADNDQIKSYMWDFGDGSVATGTEVSHVYHNPGIYNVTLTLTNLEGTESNDTVVVAVTDETAPTADAGSNQTISLSDPVVFNGSDSTDNHLIASYQWALDNGKTATGEEVVYSYSETGTYNVTLTITDEAGNKATDTATITVTDDTPPTANAGSDQTVALGESLILDGSNSTDNYQIASYQWAVGNGKTAVGKEISQSYSKTGTYEVTLTITDEAGNKNTDTATITVIDETAPVARAGSNQSVMIGESINLNASESTDNSDISMYIWNFNNNLTNKGKNISHTYGEPGRYQITLIVTDQGGNTDTDTVTIEVSDDVQTEPTDTDQKKSTDTEARRTKSDTDTDVEPTDNGSDQTGSEQGEPDTDTPSQETPGFGIGTALVGLGSGAYMLRRRLESGDNSQ
jgi:PGF-CTERM protein